MIRRTARATWKPFIRRMYERRSRASQPEASRYPLTLGRGDQVGVKMVERAYWRQDPTTLHYVLMLLGGIDELAASRSAMAPRHYRQTAP